MDNNVNLGRVHGLAALILFCIFPVDLPTGLRLSTTAQPLLLGIAGAAASIYAILTSVLLVAFESRQRDYGFRAFEPFFENPDVRMLFLQYTSCISVSVVDVLLLDRAPTYLTDKMGYTAIVLLGICIFSLPKRAQRLLSPSRSTQAILAQAKEITARHAAAIWQEQSLDLQDNPICNLSNLAVSSLREGDHDTALRIVAVMRKAIHDMTSQQVDEIRGYGEVMQMLAEKALLYRSESTIVEVLTILTDQAILALPWAYQAILQSACLDSIRQAVHAEYRWAARVGVDAYTDTLYGPYIPCPFADSRARPEQDYECILSFLQAIGRDALERRDYRSLSRIANALGGLPGDFDKEVPPEAQELALQYQSTLLATVSAKGLLDDMRCTPFRGWANAALAFGTPTYQATLTQYGWALIRIALNGGYREYWITEFARRGHDAIDRTSADARQQGMVIAFVLDVLTTLVRVYSERRDQDDRVSSVASTIRELGAKIGDTEVHPKVRDRLKKALDMLPKAGPQREGSDFPMWPSAEFMPAE